MTSDGWPDTGAEWTAVAALQAIASEVRTLNLLLGGYLLNNVDASDAAAEQIQRMLPKPCPNHRPHLADEIEDCGDA